MTALLGRNGVGKTTTVRGVLGLWPSTGTSASAATTCRLATHRLAARHRLRARGPRRLRGADGGGEPAAGRAAYRAKRVRPGLRSVPELRQRTGRRPARCPAASSRWWRSAACCSGGNRLLIADEPTKGLAPKVVTEVAVALARSPRRCRSCWWSRTSPWSAGWRRDAVVLADGRVVHTGDADGPARRPGADGAAARRLDQADRPRSDAVTTTILLTVTGLGPGRAVLPGRLRALADLRPDGRAQLRARRVAHRRRLRLVGRRGPGGGSFGWSPRSCCGAFSRARSSRRSLELVRDPAAVPATARPGARHRRARPRDARARCRRSGAPTRGRGPPRGSAARSTSPGARIPTVRLVLIGAAVLLLLALWLLLTRTRAAWSCAPGSRTGTWSPRSASTCAARSPGLRARRGRGRARPARSAASTRARSHPAMAPRC